MKHSHSPSPRLTGCSIEKFASVGTAILLLVALTQAAQTQTFRVLHTFAGQDGLNPDAGVTIDQSGNLYGTTFLGGTGGGNGSVYKLKRAMSGYILNPLYSFQGGDDGMSPESNVVFGPDGSLYGTTYENGPGGGAGTVFNLRPPASFCRSIVCPWTKTLIYAFSGGSDGAYPKFGKLTFDQEGNIYGTTYGGGAYGYGTVFELTRSGGSWTETVLHDFAGAPNDGANPSHGVIFGQDGNLYGTTYAGGSGEYGTVFQLAQSGSVWTENILADFSLLGSAGSILSAGLISDQSGRLYGATEIGGDGPGQGGTVFELSPAGDGWTLSVLYNLDGSLSQCDGPSGPWGNLALDTSGNLYGATYCEGAFGLGSVFKLTPSGGGWTYTDLHDFAGQPSDGSIPVGDLSIDANGNILGTTASGGLNGAGVVWELTP